MEKPVLEIDIHRLHREWERQPKMYHEAADALVTARSEVNRLKGRLALISAKVKSDIRENPSMFGLKKVTDDAVKDAFILDPRYQKALDQYNAALDEEGHLEALVDTLSQRKVAVENLTKLRLADYFADPRISAEARAKEDEALLERTSQRRGDR